MAEKARHAFGLFENVDKAISDGVIDAYDILFTKDAEGNAHIGWIDKNGNKVFVEADDNVIEVESLPESGESGKVYIYGENGYFWNGTQFINFCKPTDVTSLEAEIATKADVEYEVTNKPNGTLVDYRDKEIRVMCPVDTAWTLQQSGENADPLKYYIGFKAYAPDNAVSFKEDLAKTIADETMYSFEGNEFAGTDAYGRKYSIVWLPVAKYDETNDTWTYYGASSTEEKYIGWYYSVEWYDADGMLIASDCIRINLANEDCFTSIESFYVINAINTAKTYTDTQIEAKISEISLIDVVEF